MNEPKQTERAGGGCPPPSCSLSVVYMDMAVFEASCLLVTLQCGISPMCKSLPQHVEALFGLLRLSGKIPQLESPWNMLVAQQETEEGIRGLRETALREMGRRQSLYRDPGEISGTPYNEPAKAALASCQ